MFRIDFVFVSFSFQFLIATFLMEHMMNDFWFPLETNVMGALPKIADYETEILGQSGWECEGIMQIFRSETSGIIASYLLSLFFFFGAMHATRIIDFRLLRYLKKNT